MYERQECGDCEKGKRDARRAILRAEELTDPGVPELPNLPEDSPIVPESSRTSSPVEAEDPVATPSHLSSNLNRLIEFTNKEPVDFRRLCDKLNMPPGKVVDLIEEARAAGVQVHVENDHVGIRLREPDERVQQVSDIAPVVGEPQQVGVISDTHLGSKYCLRAQLVDFVEYAYAQGVRTILHPGDWVDGKYRFSVYEQSHTGLEAQTGDLFETLPQKPDLSYHGITGNHDQTFAEANGIDTGEYIESFFRKRGRDDVHFYGNRGAYLRVGGAIVHLWHPTGGGSYARSYKLQKKIEGYSSGEKPNLLLAGHWHMYCALYERGIHAIACPTFQSGRSPFSKSLSGSVAIGGMILNWSLTEHGTMRDFGHTYRAYFDREMPQRIEDDDKSFMEVKE